MNMIVMRSSTATRQNAYNTRQAALAQSRVSTLTSMPHPLVGGRRGLWWVVGLTLIWSALLLTTRPAAAQEYQLFVPSIATDGSVTEGSGGEDPEPVECGLNEQEQAVADLMVADPNQNRVNPVCDPILAQVARARARDMALRGYFSHTNPDGIGPNFLVREAGYPLPDWYGSDRDSNNIESIGAGRPTGAAQWEGWLNSPGHRRHVLGEQQFYADQEAYGVGYYFNPDSQYQHYWVFLSAPIE